MTSVKHDRLAEAFKDSCSDMNSSSRLGQDDFGVWSPTASEESKKRSRINDSSKLSVPLNDNQKAAFDSAIKQVEERV